MAPAGLEFASNPAPASRCCHHTLLPSPLKVLQMKVVDTGGGGGLCALFKATFLNLGRAILAYKERKVKIWEVK